MKPNLSSGPGLCTWKLFVPCFGASTLQKKGFSNQNGVIWFPGTFPPNQPFANQNYSKCNGRSIALRKGPGVCPLIIFAVGVITKKSDKNIEAGVNQGESLSLTKLNLTQFVGLPKENDQFR